MCGIFSYFSKTEISKDQFQILARESNKSSHRGPDDTKHTLVNKRAFLSFHRLRINDTSERGDQPMTHPEDADIVLICNGEIYNYESLKNAHSFDTYSTSDCEIILHLYKKVGFRKTIEMLDGVFACVLVDNTKNITYVARDPIGVRSLFYGRNEDEYGFCSEMKSMHRLCSDIEPFKPGHIWDSVNKRQECYYNVDSLYNGTFKGNQIVDIKRNIRALFENAVKKRLMSERPVGCLLSGGLDSSLVAALVSRFYKERLHTFSVGLEGSPDLKYARMVADHIQSIHHEVIVTERQMISAIEEDIYQIETYDTTTIRASVPMFLLSKYIKENTDITVIYSGEGSDEASGSYLYFHNAPNEVEFKKESIRLMRDLSFFDVLRCDKSTAGAGLEVRVPFLDKEFLNYYMNIPSKYKIPSFGSIEKYVLRESFNDGELLPDEVLWRVKEGMSDGVSSKKRGWYEIIQEYTETLYSDEEFARLKSTYTWNPPMFKEALYFREVFNRHFMGREQTIPYYWLPKWSGDIVEPSARVLTGVYNME